MIDGKWVDLSIDRIYGYCTLLERQLNSAKVQWYEVKG